MPASIKSQTKILVVESEAIIGADLKARLESLGYDVCRLAASGEEAVAITAAEQPDLVLMAMVLSGEMDGLQAAEIIRSRFGVPVVFVTACGDGDKLEKAKLIQPFGYVLKPFHDRDIKVTIEMALSAAQAEAERKKTEEALRAAHDQYKELYGMMRLMADNVPDLIWAKNMSGQYIFANKAICRTLLKCDSPDEVIGHTDRHFAQRVKEAGFQHTFGEVCADTDEIVKRSGEARRFIEEGLVSGEYLILDVHKAPLLNEKGEMIGTVGAGRDVTEEKKFQQALKESEEKYRLIIENVREGICVFQEEKIRFINKSGVEWSGYSLAEMMERPFVDFLHPEDRLLALERHWARQKEEDLPQNYLLRFMAKTGEIKWLEVSGVKVEWEGRPAVLVFLADVTERQRAEEKLKRALEEKEILLREIHHRVKNNMQVICSLLNLQASKHQDQRIAGAIKAGQSRILAMSLVHEFLYKSESFTEIDLSHYLKGLAGILTQTCLPGRPRPSIEVSLPPRVMVMLEQAMPCGLVLNELISNSLRHAFIDHDPAIVTIRGGRDESGWIKLVVQDNGLGMPEGLDWKNSGSLGLSLVVSLVERQLNGRVTMERDSGTRFTIEFPSLGRTVQ
ncbi:MAG: PAS domain S-box protein [Thermodesulfobacteriota bacterium]